MTIVGLRLSLALGVMIGVMAIGSAVACASDAPTVTISGPSIVPIDEYGSWQAQAGGAAPLFGYVTFGWFLDEDGDLWHNEGETWLGEKGCQGGCCGHGDRQRILEPHDGRWI